MAMSWTRLATVCRTPRLDRDLGATAIEFTPALREANFTLTLAYKSFVVEVAQLSAISRSAAAA
jgi:hypothetical protein